VKPNDRQGQNHTNKLIISKLQCHNSWRKNCILRLKISKSSATRRMYWRRASI